MNSNCPFCSVESRALLFANDSAVVFFDSYPVTEGHVLVVPLKHVASIYELSEQERADLWQTVTQVRAMLIEKFHPDGFNIGVNDGTAAGQTIGHAHIHVIPRRKDDVPDPRGGVRWIIPGKAAYWGKTP